jgi:hypothetical protein
MVSQNRGNTERMVPRRSFVKMYYFAIDFGCEIPYPLAPPQGLGSASLIFEK